MQSPTITMERNAALAKLESYERAAKDNPRAFRDVDNGILKGYRVLAKGGRLVDVNEAIKAGGLNLAGIPKLAIARAHTERATWARSRIWRGGAVPDGGGAYSYGAVRSRVSDDRVKWTMPAETFPADKVRDGTFAAMVPLIPLPLRPRHDLSNYFILWEANWHPAPPVDPYLLKPLAGSLMEIVAEWDLTPLEVAAVRGAMQT